MALNPISNCEEIIESDKISNIYQYSEKEKS